MGSGITRMIRYRSVLILFTYQHIRDQQTVKSIAFTLHRFCFEHYKTLNVTCCHHLGAAPAADF